MIGDDREDQDEAKSDQSRTINLGGVSGGNVAFSAGDMTNVHQTTTTEQTELRELLVLLRREIEAHESEVDDAPAMRESADFVEEELSRERPKAAVVRSVLADLTARAGQVASLVDVIVRIERSVAGML